MRKITYILLAAAMAGSIAFPASAAGVKGSEDYRAPSSVKIVETTEASQTASERTGIQGQVMVPLRAVAQRLGFTVTWDNGKVILDNGTTKATVTMGKDQYTIDDATTFSLGAANYISPDGTAYVPSSFFDKLLGGNVHVTAESSEIVVQDAQPGMVNPFIEFGDIDGAARLAGFTFILPDQPAGAKLSRIRAVKGSLMEVTFTDSAETLRFRKGTEGHDISGDYKTYDSTESVMAGGRPVTLRKNGGVVYGAIWTKDGFSYAITSEAGLSQEDMLSLVEATR